MDDDSQLPNIDDEDIPGAVKPREHVGPNYHQQSHKSRNILISLLILVLLAGGGAYAYNKHNQSQKKAKAAASTQAAAAPKATTQIDAATKSYTSPNFFLSFKYPADWKITDTGGGTMTVLSPAIQLKNAVGQIVPGQIEMQFLNSPQNLSGFSDGNAVAVIASQNITYTNPTPDQRAATYLSFLQYASTTTDGLDAIYITSDNGYQQGQAIPLVDISKEDPIINITFLKCADSSCQGKTTPLTIDAASWDDASFSNPLKTMFQSLNIT